MSGMFRIKETLQQIHILLQKKSVLWRIIRLLGHNWWQHILHIIALFRTRTVDLAVGPRTEESLKEKVKTISDKT